MSMRPFEVTRSAAHASTCCRFHQPRHAAYPRCFRGGSSQAQSSHLVVCQASSQRTPKRGIAKEARETLLKTIEGVKGRGKSGLTPEQFEDVESAVRILEKDGGVQGPTASGLLEGRWRLLFTTRPGSASPIQKTFVGVDAFTVYQEVLDSAGQGRVNNIVDFGPKVGALKVEAEASTESNPRQGFVPRQKPGLKIFGKSSSKPASSTDMRIDFQFDKAAFSFSFLPFKIPYPVPFKLLGDETKGWIDITYLSEDGQLRLTRGNKGTLFILQKDASPKERLLDAVNSNKADDQQIEQLVEQLQSCSPEKRPASSAKTQGKWKLLWSMQAKSANYLQKALAGKVNNFQIISQDEAGQGQVMNLVQLGPLLSIQAGGSCKPQGASRTMVSLDDIQAQLGPLRIPLPRGNSKSQDDQGAYVDWLYLDNDLRITRGSAGSLFIHTKS